MRVPADVLALLLEEDGPLGAELVPFSRVPSLRDLVLLQHFLNLPTDAVADNVAVRVRLKQLRKERDRNMRTKLEQSEQETLPEVTLFSGVPLRPLADRLRSKLADPSSWAPPVFFPDVFVELPPPVVDPSQLTRESIAYLLGMRRTRYSISDYFPPSPRALLDSFRMPHEKNGRIVGLSRGGRALTKHCQRSISAKFWPSAKGSSHEINQRAEYIVLRILRSCIWMNAHLLPHETPIFEIRIAEGFGARWTADLKLEFRGFLEPPSLEGHEKNWIH